MKERIWNDGFKKFLGLDKTFRVQENQLGSIMGEEEIEAVAQVLRGGGGLSWTGENLWLFEQEFAKYCGVKHAVVVSSCTSALRIATQMLRIRKEDEIITTPQTFHPTIVAAAERGAKIRFADIEPYTLNIDPATIEDKITSKTKAIFVCHMNGNPVDMDPILEISKRHGIVVVEDAAHAPGAEYKGRKIGGIGDITCFSFHSLKNMTTGEGGMITTNNDRYAQEARELRTMGIIGNRRMKTEKTIGPYKEPVDNLSDHSDGAFRYELTNIEEWGSHARMSEVLAAIGRVQLRKLDSLNAKRIKIANEYNNELSNIRGLRLLKTTNGAKCIYHLYPIFLDRKVIAHDPYVVGQYLENEQGIHIIRRFFPIHLLPYMQLQGHHFGECPVAEKIFFEELLNLPICTAMPEDKVEIVIDAVKKTVEHFVK